MKVVLILMLSLAVANASNTTEAPEQDQDQDLIPENIITNGYTAAAGAVPYIVYLSFRNAVCGGSIIGHTWVITASHCTKPYNSVTIHYGSLQRARGTLRHTVSGNNIINHPSDDIALIRTPHVEFTKLINLVKLPSASERNNLYVNQWSTACGWGKTTSTSSPTNLSCVNLQVVTNAQCSRFYGSRAVTNQILCVSTPGGKSICFGDSGGPLVTMNNQTLIGVSNFVSGRGCTAGDPAGFARVTSHLNWIREHTGIAY